jgi:hypothetical protein
MVGVPRGEVKRAEILRLVGIIPDETGPPGV